MSAIKARVALLDHLEAVKDRVGMRLAYEAFEAMDYMMGAEQEMGRNMSRQLADAFRARGVVGPGFSVTWNNGELTHLLTETGK